MAQLTAHLLDGFDHDRVVLTVGGQVAGEAEDVTTLLLIGAAEATLTAAVADGRVTVGIEVPTRGLDRAQELDLEGDVHLLVSIQAGVLGWTAEDTAPGYM
jgi:hypothetical protein